jgi:putative heme iron utilization protein
VLDAAGEPMILISSLAQHTKNIAKDNKVSLTVWDDTEGDPQAVGRLTWISDAVKIQDDGTAQARYIAYMPSAAGHFQAHDFALYRLQLKRGRYIGGFGAIFWVERDAMMEPNPLASAEAGILKHMNEDHAAAMVKYCLAFKKLEVGSATMVGIDPLGFDVVADGNRVRFEFEAPVTTPEEVRAAMVKLSRASA